MAPVKQYIAPLSLSLSLSLFILLPLSLKMSVTSEEEEEEKHEKGNQFCFSCNGRHPFSAPPERGEENFVEPFAP